MISPMMDIEALKLGSRFALKPNSLGYCGRESAVPKTQKCVLSGECQGVEEEFVKFIALNPYLSTIASITGLPKFSYPVMEAYWLGNDQLRKAKLTDYEKLLDNFIKQGVPRSFVRELRQRPPVRFIPHHLFQVLQVGVGRVSGVVPFNIDTINDCMIRWGKVENITDGRALVNLSSLHKIARIYQLTSKPLSVPINPDFVPGLQKGDTVAVHWKMMAKILTPPEVANLEYWTNEVLQAVV